LPPRAQGDDSALVAMNASMQPILSTHVFARINETVEGITPEDRPDADPIDLAEGHDVLLKYSLVRNLVLEGKVQLH
jgi:DNA replication complex GINS protein SLD5 C-terminus